ncbi:MAG: hemagglutinin repeat-containing protein, partial [Paucibacter sp.]|nr:hemagglutinin repeat-containing protein [Roseateles sp.]
SATLDFSLAGMVQIDGSFAFSTLTGQTVTLADGSTQQVLVPQVYLRHLDQADVQPTGALIAARDIGLKSTGDIVNDNAAIQSAGLLKLQAANELRNQGGQLRGRDVLLDAGRDLNNLGGSIQAQGDGSNNGVLIAKAGRDLLLQSTTQTSTNAYGTRTNVDRVATVQGGDVSLAAARDLLAQGAQIGANGSGARLVASAGGALKVTAVQTSSSASATLGSAEGGVHNAGNYVQYSTQAQVGSNLHSDGSATLVAGQQLELTASDLSAAGRIALAGASVNIQAGVNSQTRDAQVITRSGYSQLATTTQTLTGGSVQAGTGLSIIATGKDASGDITLQGANVGTATGTAVLSATRDVSITSLATTDTLQSARLDTSRGLLSSKTTTTQASRSATTQNGSNVNGQTVLIVAGDAKTQTGDITIAGSSITSQGLTQLHAGRDLNITSVEQSSGDASSSQTVKQSSGLAKTLGAAALISSSGLSVMESAALMGRSGAQGQAQHSATQAVGSTISAGSLITDSGLDTTVQASTVVADSDIVMHAGRDMNIAPGTNTQTEQTSASNRKTGAIGEVWQPAVGTVRQSSDGQQTATTHTGSQIASLGGNVSLSADNHYTQTGSNVLAPQGDVDIAAQRVLIDAATDTSQGREHSSYSKTALGGSVSAPLLSAAQGARQSVQAGSKTGDTRLQALAAVTAGLQAKGALDAGQALAGGNLGGIKVSASIGSTKSDTTTEQTASTAVGSRVAAGGNVSIRATGAGADSTLDVIGSDISAGGKTRLKADGAVSLLAAQDSSEQQSKNSASSASLGIGYAMGGAQNGFTLDVSASKGRGHADGTDITQVNTHVSGQQVDIQSGGDTNLRGAVVTANQVTGQIGGNLNVQSLQDTSSYKAKQESAGFSASICVPPFCAGASTVSASV